MKIINTLLLAAAVAIAPLSYAGNGSCCPGSDKAEGCPAQKSCCPAQKESKSGKGKEAAKSESNKSKSSSSNEDKKKS